MRSIKYFSFLQPSLLFLLTVPLLAEGQQHLLQNDNLALLHRLNISGNPYSSYLGNGLSAEMKAKLMAKVTVPDYVQDLLEIFQEHDSNGTMDKFLDKLFDRVESEDCKGHVLEWAQRFNPKNNFTWLTEKDQWAAHMIDSWGKFPPEGFLTGHVSALGDFDECVQVKARDINILNKRFPNISRSFEGKYCTSNILAYGLAAGGSLMAQGIVTERGDINEARIDPSYWPRADLTDIIEAREALPVNDFLMKMLFQKFGLMMIMPSVASCMPSTCSTMDIQNIYLNVMTMAYAPISAINETLTFLLPAPVVMSCRVEKKPDMDAPVIIVIILLATLLALSIGAGAVDYWFNQGLEKGEKAPERGQAYKYFMAFSLYTNTRKFLSTRRSPDDLGCLHGIRFFSTAWVVLGHTYSVFKSGPQWNLWDLKNAWKNWSLLAVINGTFSVDTFFLMSGMLATYSLLKLLDKNKGKLNVPMFYIHRIVRLTPTYAILVGIGATLFVYLGNGPMWGALEHAEKTCRKSWWINLLYINNIYLGEGMCNGESWYLANDMQFYILSPFIVYPIWRWRKLGLSLLVLLTVLSIVSRVLVSHYQEALPGLFGTRDGIESFLNVEKIYNRPWTRIVTFLVGVWLGWILHITRGKRVKLPIWAVAGGWIVSTGLVLAVIFGNYKWFDPEYEIPEVAKLFYAGLGRFSYAVGVAWVIFACVKGYGGIVNSFLSWGAFMPLGRLCFTVYLLSFNLQQIFHFGLKVPIQYTTYNVVNIYFSHMVMSYLVGFVATMLFESPFIVLQRLIFEGK